MTKLQVMEKHWNTHGIASSFAQMAGELRHYWPQRNDSYNKECIKFIAQKKLELSQRKNPKVDNTVPNMIGTLARQLELIFHNNITYFEIRELGIPIPNISYYSGYGK